MRLQALTQYLCIHTHTKVSALLTHCTHRQACWRSLSANLLLCLASCRLCGRCGCRHYLRMRIVSGSNAASEACRLLFIFLTIHGRTHTHAHECMPMAGHSCTHVPCLTSLSCDYATKRRLQKQIWRFERTGVWPQQRAQRSKVWVHIVFFFVYIFLHTLLLLLLLIPFQITRVLPDLISNYVRICGRVYCILENVTSYYLEISSEHHRNIMNIFS